ncbi:MAG TPA: UbiA family prenyltransferase, partial [Saprospiraceae bacterium]|nr:UbiA family prenyltransferase [Saprospiraceae bacterium]
MAIIMVKLFFNLVRWPNLVIIAILQVVVYLRLMHSERSILSWRDLSMLILITAIISAGGYVINDYFDVEIDKINKPHKWKSRHQWTRETLYKIFMVLFLSGLVITAVAAIQFGILFYLALYLAASIGLYVYSSHLKCAPVIGNLVVALYCAATVMIVALPDLHAKTPGILLPGFYFYVFFAFSITMYREIIKDIEDVAGDLQMQCRTFVARYGPVAGKLMAIIFGLVLMVTMQAWKNTSSHLPVIIGLWILQAGLLASFILLVTTNKSRLIHNTSLLVKMIM